MRRFVLGWAVSVIAAMSPTWASASDQEAAQRIADTLRGSGQFVDYSIGVKYQEGTAWLLGRVSSQEQMDRAIEMTRQMPDVSRVVNNLDIRPTARPSTRSRRQAGRPQPAQPVASSAERSAQPAAGQVAFRTVAPTVPVSPKMDSMDLAARQPAVRRAHPAAAASRSSARREASTEELPAADPSEFVMPTQAQQPLPATQVPAEFAEMPELMAPAAADQTAPQVAMLPVQQAAPPTQSQLRRQALQPHQQRRPVPLGQPISARGRVATAQPQPARAPQGRAGQGYHQGPVARVAQAPGAYADHAPLEAQMHGAPMHPAGGISGAPVPMHRTGLTGGAPPAYYDQPHLPNYAWPSYAAYPNYAGLTYPVQYSPTAWPYIGPFYPYPQVPLGWRRVTLEWDDGWWFLDFEDKHRH